MGITGHLLLVSDDEIDAVLRDPSALYDAEDDEDELDEIFTPKPSRWISIQDVGAMSWILSGESPGVEQVGPPPSIAFLHRGGTPFSTKLDVCFGGPVRSVSGGRLFSPDETRSVAEALDAIDQAAVARKGGPVGTAQLASLKELLQPAVAKREMFLVHQSQCLVLSEKERAKLASGAKRKKKQRKPSLLDREGDVERHVDLDRLYDATTRVLDAADRADGTWRLFERGGVVIGPADGEGFGYGPARAFRPNEVAALAGRMAAMGDEAIRANVSAQEGAYRVCDGPDDHVALRRQIHALLERAAATAGGIVAYLS
ncbi:MAG: DUF1877 family protein [Polyangiaceae bacterium]|nr:DUF1877 family protein [Polyangiaceae bacterium]